MWVKKPDAVTAHLLSQHSYIKMGVRDRGVVLKLKGHRAWNT